MVLTLKDAEIGKLYRIKDIVNMSLGVSKRLMKQGVVNESKIVLIDRTTYGYHLFEAVHPNGDTIKSSVSDKEAERIHIEEFDDNFVIIDLGE